MASFHLGKYKEARNCFAEAVKFDASGRRPAVTIELNDERKFSIIKVTTKQVHERDFYDFSVTGLQRCGTSFIFN